MPYSTYPPQSDNANDMWQLMKPLLMKMSPSTSCSILCGSKYSPRQSVLKLPQSTEDSALYMAIIG